MNVLAPPEKPDATTSINGTKHKIQVINVNSFKIGDTTKFSPYVRGGLAKNLKAPVEINFKSLKEIHEKNELPLDQNVSQDFAKFNHPFIGHICFKALDEFRVKYNRFPTPWNLPESDKFMEIVHDIHPKFASIYKANEDKLFERIARLFAFTAAGTFAPVAAFIGGYVGQEILKALTGKYMPTRQYLYFDGYEALPQFPPEIKWEDVVDLYALHCDKPHRSQGLVICLGDQLVQELAYANLFMVGAGAIGCELLKNYAMLGVGTGEPGKNNRKEGGLITMTDPDVIEVSNLNRQFLFREKHLRKPKSSTAAAAAIQMNKEMKGHIIARLDKVHEGTQHIFTDRFFESQTVVTNALDNVAARRYIDSRCVSSKTPLLESGTLGPKGHVQVIIPYQTESYGSQQDPQEEGEIPHCTLKMFPEETLHCVEWARDKFGKLFTQRPKSLVKLVEELENYKVTGSQELKTLREALTLLKKKPVSFEDCIKYARHKFQKYYVNDIRQLLYTYPLDAKTKEGNPFWSLPKRPPTEVKFDAKNTLHQNFICALAALRARVFNIPLPQDLRSAAMKVKYAEEAAKINVPDFVPSSDKAKQIAAEIDKDKNKAPAQQQEEPQQEEVKGDEIEETMKEFKKLVSEVLKNVAKNTSLCTAEEFEKDDDTNFHIDFIHALANCRSLNYKLDPMDWMTVKIKAGRIIPALPTTTACSAGLQSLELVKLLAKAKVDQMKNAFFNLAIPILAPSEPGPPPKSKLTPELSVTIWDRWEVKFEEGKEITLKKVFDDLQSRYKILPRDALYNSALVFMHAMMSAPGKEKEKQEALQKPLAELLQLDVYSFLVV
jgi:ubiquitin-activating enzyme E1